MRAFPPKLPQLYNSEYKLNNKKSFSKANETLGLLIKDNIPNVFYNHLMVNERNGLFPGKHICNRILIKKRIKKKLINIIYYSPWINLERITIKLITLNIFCIYNIKILFLFHKM